MYVTFCDYFGVPPKTLDTGGFFNISLLSDLPLFIDPFLLFNSKRKQYQQLHQEMIDYLIFLRDKSSKENMDPGLVGAWYTFPEVRQNWLGFSVRENRGAGLGRGFANALNNNLHAIFKDFGKEKVTKESHLEKLCLIADGVGRDKISDFTTNLIKGHLLESTQAFAQEHIDPKLRRICAVEKVAFNYQTESWQSATFELPWFSEGEDYVILTPKEILTKDDIWINKIDLLEHFDEIPDAIPNDHLRGQVNNYLLSLLTKKSTRQDEIRAAADTILHFPELIDYYIKGKEEHGDRATSISTEKVRESDALYTKQFKILAERLASLTEFYNLKGDTHAEAHKRVQYLKEVIENNDGYRLFYYKGKPIERETDAHVLYRLTWFASTSDLNSEVNNGRGPVDFKASRGSADKTLVEFKLASNPQLKKNLLNQVEVYKKANQTKKSIKVILYFTEPEYEKVLRILKEIDATGDSDIVLVDARQDNKPSASKA